MCFIEENSCLKYLGRPKTKWQSVRVSSSGSLWAICEKKTRNKGFEVFGRREKVGKSCWDQTNFALAT